MIKPVQSHPRLIARARRLRRDQTKAEKTFWRAVSGRRLAGLKFRRQVQIGSYIADFVCHEQRLIVEIDGGQHTPGYDAARTAFLERAGYRVVRFWNTDVLENTAGVLEALLNEVETES